MNSPYTRICFSVMTVCLVVLLVGPLEAASPVLVALDTDGDGSLSIEEIGAIEPIIATTDANKDGTLSAEELTGMLEGASPERVAALKEAIASVKPADDAEKKILVVLDDLDKNHRRGNLNVPVQDGQLLRLLVEAIGAKHTAEIGMSNGYSTIWTAAGLRKSGGMITTYEIDEGRAAQARKNFADAGVADMITIVMGDAHENVKSLEGPIDMVFIDADKEGYVDYLRKVFPKVRKGGLIIAHNTTMSGTDEYVKVVTTCDRLDTVLLHKKGRGAAVSIKK